MPMKWIQYLSLTLIGLVPLLGLAVMVIGVWFDTAMTPKCHVDNYTKAQASGIMDRGWIPH
jgi:hypothetical protein